MHTLTVGTYDGGLIGFDLEEDKQVIGYTTHLGSIKTLATYENVLCSTSTDETAKVYDLDRRREIGQIREHNGYVTACCVFRRSHIITGGEDGKICIWKYGDLELSRTFNCSSPITAMAIHPTGKMLLSAHKRTKRKAPFVQLWDLTRGTSAAMLPLALNVECVCWSGSGSHYALLPEDGLNVQVLEGSTSSVMSQTRTKEDRITAIGFTGETLLLGDVNGQVVAVTAGQEPVVLREAGAPGRVRAITVSPDGITAIAFPNGLVEVYRADREEVQTFDTDARLTSIAIGSPKTPSSKKNIGKKKKKVRYDETTESIDEDRDTKKVSSKKTSLEKKSKEEGGVKLDILKKKKKKKMEKKMKRKVQEEEKENINNVAQVSTTKGKESLITANKREEGADKMDKKKKKKKGIAKDGHTELHKDGNQPEMPGKKEKKKKMGAANHVESMSSGKEVIKTMKKKKRNKTA